MVYQKTKRVCEKGHIYYKSSDCPVCPVCASEKKPATGFMSMIAAPARRALLSHQIYNLQALSKYSKKEVHSWHGMGHKALTFLEEVLQEAGLDFLIE